MGETLSYYTCGNWMKLALFAQKRWQEWLDRPQGVDLESDDIASFLREVAQYAFDFGFSLRQGDRLYGFLELLNALGDERLKTVYYRLKANDWLTPTKSKPRGGDGYFYVLAWPKEQEVPFYVTIGSTIGNYAGRHQQLTWNGVYGAHSRDTGTIFQTDSYTEAKRVRDSILRASDLYTKATTTTKPPKTEGQEGVN